MDAAGNVCAGGSFQGTVDMDPGPGAHMLTAGAAHSNFVCKLDPSGNFLWAAQIDRSVNGVPCRVAVDASGNVYVMGAFSGTVDFDPGPDTYSLTAVGYEMYLCKLDANGNFLWAGKMEVYGFSIVTDPAENVYLLGNFIGTADFDPGPGVYTITGEGAQDVFVCKLDSSGNFVWAKMIGNAGHAWAWSMALDDSGNVYATGDYTGTLDFDPGPGTYNLGAGDSDDAFVFKLDSNGNFVWARHFAGSGRARSLAIAVDGYGNVLTAGNFDGVVDFDPGPDAYAFDGRDSWVMFMSKLDAEGNFVWAKQVGEVYYSCNAKSVTVDLGGNVYLCGTFSGTVDFDPAPSTHYLTVPGLSLYVTKFDPDGNLLLARNVDTNDYVFCDSMVLDSSANIYAAGSFGGTADFDPGFDVLNLTASGSQDGYLVKLYTTIHPCDISQDNVVNAVDVQLTINKALGLAIRGDADVNQDGGVDAIDIQTVINAALEIA